MDDNSVLVSIFHKQGKDDDNFEKLKNLFSDFDIYIPTVEYYGNKWTDTKNYFLKNNYASLFVICSDIRIVCGDISLKIIGYSRDRNIGVYGFGTINNCTFNWLKYDNTQLIKPVPFIEGYCFGINRNVFNYIKHSNTYGYGLDVEIGYESNLNGLQCFVDNEVCISHEFGKSYNDQAATIEYSEFLIKNPSIYAYLKELKIFTPI